MVVEPVLVRESQDGIDHFPVGSMFKLGFPCRYLGIGMVDELEDQGVPLFQGDLPAVFQPFPGDLLHREPGILI